MDLNAYLFDGFASRRGDRWFVTVGAQGGVALNPPKPIGIGSVFAGTGVEVFDDRVALTVEGIGALHHRYSVTGAVVTDIGGMKWTAGAGVVSIGGASHPMIEGLISLPLIADRPR